MRKLIAVAILVAFGFMLGSNGAVMAQKEHAPKAVWKGMVAWKTIIKRNWIYILSS